MTAKEFLSQAWRIDERIESRLEEIERLEARLESGRMASITGMPRGGASDWTDTANRVIELKNRIGAEVGELCRVKRMVNEAIDAVEDVRYRRVLELRYRNYYTWEKIAEEMDYDARWVRRLHADALGHVVVPECFA